MSIWLNPQQEEYASYSWPVFPGVEVAVSCVAGKFTVGYLFGAGGREVFLRARPLEMERSREEFGLAFTYGQA